MARSTLRYTLVGERSRRTRASLFTPPLLLLHLSLPFLLFLLSTVPPQHTAPTHAHCLQHGRAVHGGDGDEVVGEWVGDVLTPVSGGALGGDGTLGRFSLGVGGLRFKV